MINKIEKTAKRLRKEIKGEIDVLPLVKFTPKTGYRVVFFNNPDEDGLIELYNLQEIAKATPAFTISGEDNIVFVNDTVHPLEQTYLLLHELGHILLGHITDGDLSLGDRSFLEAEADAFVYEVVNPHKRNIALQLAILFTVVALGFVCGFISRRAIPDSAATDTVIITQNGESYHREGCMAIKGKDFISIPRSQAKKIFDRCGVCNP